RRPRPRPQLPRSQLQRRRNPRSRWPSSPWRSSRPGKRRRRRRRPSNSAMPGAAASGAAGGGEYLVVATIRKPHGVRGELALMLETDRPGAVFRKGRRLILGDAIGRPLGRALTVERARSVPDGLLLKVAE